MRLPSSASSAGSSVSQQHSDRTTTIAPAASERSAAASIANRLASATITVRPLNTTATPEVVSAVIRASSCERPARSSSR